MPHPLIALILFVVVDVVMYRTLREVLAEEIAYLRLRRGGTRLRGQVVSHEPRPSGGRNRSSRQYTVVPKVRYAVDDRTFEATVDNYGGELIPVGNGMDLVVDVGYPDRPFAVYAGTSGPAVGVAFAALVLFGLMAVVAAASLR